MRYLSIYKAVETGLPPTPEMMEKMGRLIEESMRSGELVETGGWQSSKTGIRVRRDDGQVTVTDGPFTESKELIAGYAILEARSKEHLIEIVKKFLVVAGGGECEIRPLHGEPAGH